MKDARQGVLLVDGYIRENLSTKSLPLCLSRLCLNFWKPYIHWRVPTQPITTRHHSSSSPSTTTRTGGKRGGKSDQHKKETMWISKSSKLYDIDGFRFLLQLHGLSRNLSLNMIQQEIVYEHRKNDIIVYYEIYSPQMGYCCKGSAFKNMCISVWSKSVTLDYDVMNCDEPRHKALDFYVHLDVLKHPSLTVPVDPIRMSQRVTFQWRLDRELDSDSYHYGDNYDGRGRRTRGSMSTLCTLYSPNFDVSGNWCCCFWPKRIRISGNNPHHNVDPEEVLMVGLKLLRMNCNIKCIVIDCTMILHCDSTHSDHDGGDGEDGINITEQRRIRFTEYENENSVQWMVKDSRIDLIRKVRSISVQIAVYKVYVHDLSTPTGRIVSRSNWNTYHIV